MGWLGHEPAGETCGGAGNARRGEGQGGADIKPRARTPLVEETEFRLNRLIYLLRVAGLARPRKVCSS